MGDKNKINKNEFLSMIAKDHDMSLSDVKAFYSASIDEMLKIVSSGKELSLTGFGNFSLKQHKGHPVQFEAKSDTVSDYVVLKFTASDVLMARIRAAYADGVNAAE